MKKALFWILGISCFAALGNGQDDAVATTPPPNGWGVQGNVAWTKAQHAAELEKAALAARQQKALKEAMGSYSRAAPPIMTAEQFLAANRPPASASPPLGDSAPVNLARRQEYVPAFESTPARAGRGEPSTASVQAASGSSTVDLPQKRFGLRDLFRGKEKGANEISGDLPPNPYVDSPPIPASTYPTPLETVVPPAADSSEMAPPAADAINEATLGTLEGPGPEKPSFFGRLFGKNKSETPGIPTEPAAPAPVEGAALPSMLAEAGGEAGDGVPAPPTEMAPAGPARSTPQAGEEGGIFVSRGAEPAGGNSATVLATTQATVAGVLVRLYEDTPVTVLERSGSEVRIRLADGREGIIAASALSR